MRNVNAMAATSLLASLVLAAPAVANPQPATQATAAGRSVSALRLLSQLPVHPERGSGYDRSRFADWLDADGDGCDTRDEVLTAESVTRPRIGADCNVRGRWVSRYDGVRTRDSSSFDIDHLVPLAEAWGSGSRRWGDARRDHYSNDLGYRFSLIAVSASSNRSKGDSDPAEWLPPRRAYWCTYAKQYTAVKWRWGLSVDRAERTTLRRLIRGCASRLVTRPHRA